MVFVIYVFIIRILTVFLSTQRVICVFKHKKIKSFFLTFISVLAWIVIVKDILDKNNNIYVYTSYTIGYAIGTILGVYYENKKTPKQLLLYIISKDNNITKVIEKNNYNYTIIPCLKNMKNEILVSLKIDSRKVNALKTEILNIDNKAYMYTELLRNSYNLRRQ